MSRDLEEETGLHTGWIQNGGLFIASNRQRLDEYKRLMSVGVALPGVRRSPSWGAGAAWLGEGALTDPGHHRTQMLLLLGHLGQAAVPPRASASSPLKWAHIVERDALSPGHGRGPVRGALTAAVLSAHGRQATYEIAPLGAVHTLFPPPLPRTGLGRAGVQETGREAYAAADPWIGLGRCFLTQNGQAWTPNPRTGCSSDLSFMEC